MERDYGNLGNLHTSQGELGKAKRMYEAALAMAKAVGHKDGMALTYVNLAGIEEARGETGEARELLTRALELYQQIGNKEEVRKLSARLNPKPVKPKSKRPAPRTLSASPAAKGGPRRPARKGAAKKSGVRPYRPFVGSKKR
jgi:tetratricopeptide (TPR) repeat protein